jgi:hypothetical protein
MRRGRLVFLFLVSACAHGRVMPANPYADAGRDCRSAATLLDRGRAATPRMSPQLWRVRACPARAGQLLAGLLRESRITADTAELEANTWLTQYVHDANLLAAGIDVASDRMASEEARWAALRVLLWSKAPGHPISLQAMLEEPSCDPHRCRSTYTGHFFGSGPFPGDTTDWPVFGTVMPAGYVARIDSVAHLLVDDPSTPPPVRRAAGMVLLFPRDRELGGR